MINIGDKQIECSVHVVQTSKLSNIRRFDDTYDILGKNIPGGDNYIIEFRIFDKVIATSDGEDGYPTIGYDFIWSWIKNPNIRSVRVSYDSDNKVKIHNGVVVVSPVKKLYSETDVIDMLSYALTSDSNENIKEKIIEVLGWFKTK